MPTDIINNVVSRLLNIPNRLRSVVLGYLLTLMCDGPKRTFTSAAKISGLDKSQFSRLLKNHGGLAEKSLTNIAMHRARKLAVNRKPLSPGCPWTIAIIVDSTLHPRSSKHIENSQSLNHGKGFIVGHQWTNILLVINEQSIALPPIPYLTRSECKRRKIIYETEQDKVINYLKNLRLELYVPDYEKKEIVVLTDSGYDNKKLQRSILELGWDFLTSLKTTRSAITINRLLKKPKEKWPKVNALFKATKRQAPWETVRVTTTAGKKKKRRSFRARKLIGRIKGVPCDVAMICSEKSNGKGRRYFACSKADLTIGTIIRVYAKRWKVELFHRAVKSQFGMLDAGVCSFDAMKAHVHWVYCAWMLLQEIEIGDSDGLLEKQRNLQKAVILAPIRKQVLEIIANRNRFGGRNSQKLLIQEGFPQTIAV